MLYPIYQGTASSHRLNLAFASIYRFTEMRQRSPADTELHSLPQIFTVSSAYQWVTGRCILSLFLSHTRTHTDTEGGKSSPQPWGHPSAAGFFQPEHLASSAVIYGDWFLMWGFFCYDRDLLPGGGRAAIRAGEEKEKR